MIKATISGCVFEDIFREGSYHSPNVVTRGIPKNARLVRIEPRNSCIIGAMDWHFYFDDGFEEVSELSIQALRLTAEEAANRECEFGTRGLW